MTDSTDLEIIDAAKQEWAAAWVKAWAEMPDIPQGRKVTIKTDKGSYSYTYAALPDILGAVRPVLTKHGFAVSQSVVQAQGGIGVETRITHKAGHSESYGPTFVVASGDAKAYGAGITYARRYSLAGALGIATDEDVDAPEPAAVKNKPAAPDLHQEAWEHAMERGGDGAKDLFREALEDAGIKAGEQRIANAAQAKTVRAFIDKATT